MSRFRFISRILAALTGLIVLVVAVVATLFYSDTFSEWLLTTLAERSDGMFSIEAIDGSFGGGLRVGSLEVELEGASVAANRVDLRMDWRSLVARSIIVDYLRIERLNAEIVDSGGSSDEVEPNELTTLVLIRELGLDEISIAVDESAYLVRQTSLELRLLRNRLELNELTTTYDDMGLRGDVALTLASELAVEASVCVDGMLADEQIEGCLNAIGNMPTLEVDAQIQQPFLIAGNGVINVEENGSVDFEAAWQSAALSSIADFSSDRGSLRVTGTITQPDLDADGVATYAGETADFSVRAAVDETAINLDSLRLTQDSMTADLTGTLGRSLERGDFVLAATNINPQRWVVDWPGQLNVNAEFAVAIEPDISINASEIVARGTLRGNPVAGLGSVSYANESVAIQDFELVSRSDRIVLSGTVAEEIDLALEATVNDLAAIAEGFQGSLAADLVVSGTMVQPAIRGAVEMADLVADGVSAESIRLSGDFGIAPDDLLELTATVTGAIAGGTDIGTALLNIAGTATEHQFTAQLGADAWSARLAGSGGITDSEWSGQLAELDFVPADLGVWRLQVPAEIRYSVSGYAVSELCLNYQLSGICASVAVDGSPQDSLAITAVNFDLGILAPFTPAGIRAKGLVNGSAELSNFSDDPRGSVSIAADDAQLDFVLAEDLEFPVPVARFEIATLLDDTGATISASLDAAELGGVTAAFVFDEPLEDDTPLQGSLNLEWHDASVLGLLSPDVDGVTGRIDANLSVAGTAAAPLLSGAAGWSSGRVEVPAWGLVIEQIEAAFDAAESREAVFQAAGLVDSAPIEMSGTMLLEPDQGWPIQLELRGEDLSLVQLAEIQMRVSPDLRATARLPDIEVSGEVAVPFARIRDVTLPEQAIVPSPDTVVHGQTIDEPERPLNVVADLVLELGEEVTYQDANLNASVTGRLDLDYQSGDGATAQGALSLAGEYDAYGNPLVLERGQLIFVGPLDDPTLDILAVREIGEVTAGVQVTGTLNSPVTALFSDPAMSDADALGWLLFGRPLDESRETDSAALRNAALSMGLQQALPVIERIGESLRLDDFAIRSTEADAGALMAGKYLSPNLYFRYSYGLFNRIGGLLLRYRINDRFSLETRSGEHNSMDLLYTVEKD